MFITALRFVLGFHYMYILQKKGWWWDIFAFGGGGDNNNKNCRYNHYV